MAAIETRVQFFNSFLGLQEGIHSTIMPDSFSSDGSKNVWMDQYARVTKILGYAKQNSSAVTTDTGGSAAALVGLQPYRGTVGGSITRQLVGVFDDGANEWEIHTSTDQGANWTFRKDMGSSNAGKLPDFAQMDDDMFITDGVNTPQRWTGSAISNAGGTQSPTPSASATGTGPMAGTFQWKLVSVETDGSRHPGSAASTAIQLTSENAALSWTADSDGDVVGYEIYRTTATGKTFYFVDYKDVRTSTSYTDTLSDLKLLENRVLKEHGDAPPAVYFVEPFKQRMWWGRTDANPLRVFFSDPGDADSVWLNNNFIDFSDPESEGDFITGMVGNFEDTLVVFLERSIFRISGTGEIIGNIVDWTRDRSNAHIGSVSHRGIQRVRGGAKYVDQYGDNQTTNVVTLAYMTPLGDIRLFDGENDVVISHAVTKTLDTVNYAQRAKVVSVDDKDRDQITWYFASNNSTTNDRAVTWNYRYGVWYEWTPQPFASVTAVESATEKQVLLAGQAVASTGGFCYKLWSGNSFDGSNIEAAWMTKVIMGVNEGGIPIIHKTKRWRWIEFVMTGASNVTITVEWIDGFASKNSTATGSFTASTTSGTIKTSDGNNLLTTGGNQLVVSQDSLQKKIRMKPYLLSKAMRMRFKDNSTTPAWSVESFSLAYQPLEGIRTNPTS